MKKVKQKTLSLLLSFAMLFGMVQGAAVPAFAEVADSVSIGGINYTYQSDVSETGLDLSTAPTEVTCYKAGDGYALFTPANGGTPATLVLHGATISSAAYNTLYLGAETVITLEGANRLTNTRTEDGVGIDNYLSDWQDTVIQGGSGDSLIVSAWTGIFAGNLTISGGNVTANGSAYGIITTGDMLIENGAQVSAARDAAGYALDVGNGDYDSPYNLTISGASSLTISGEANLTGSLSIGSGTAITVQADSIFWADCTTSITNNGTIVNNGIFRLPYSYTAEQVNALNIPGTIQLYSSELDKYKIYANGEFYADGGDVSTTGLDLTTVPTEVTYYKAGDGYALFTPANGGTPATLALTNATINAGADSAITLPGTAVNIELSGKNTLRSNGKFGILGIVNCAPTITSSNSGTLDIEAKAYALAFEKSYDKTLTIGGNASVTAISYQATAVIVGGNLTVESGARFAAKGVMVDVWLDGTFQALNFTGSVATVNQTISPAICDITIYGACEMPGILQSMLIGTSEYVIASLHIPSSAQMTIPSGDTMIVMDMSKLKLEGKLVNNGVLILPLNTTAGQIKALKLTGTGRVVVPDSMDASGMPSKDGKTYTNEGVALKVIGAEGSGLDLTTGDHSGKTVANDGYSWDSSSKTLTLGNVLINGDVTLPAAATINTTAFTVIQGQIMGESGAALNLVFSGTAPLDISGAINGGINEDTVTVKNGAQVIMGSSIFLGASGGTGGTLNVTGSGTKLTVSSPHGYAVMCDTVNVSGGASLTAKAEGNGSMGVEALAGGVNVTGGSTLTTGCDYGIYIIDGKLTVDGTSKLITNGAVAPFCIVDTTSAKAQSAVLALAAVPNETEIASVAGTSGRYWSLVSTGGSLSVSNEGNTPVALTGALAKFLSFVKPANPTDNSGKNSPSSLPSVLTDAATNVAVGLSGASFPSGVTGLALSVTRVARNSTTDTQGAALYPASEADAKLNVIGTPAVYNIKLLDQNGNAISGFTGTVGVTIPLPAGLRGTPRVFRYEANGTFTDMKATAEKGFLTFSTDHFSYYVIAGTGNSIILDTTSYQMPLNGSYQIGVKLTGSKAASVKVYPDNSKTAAVKKLANGNYQVTSKNPGTVYIMYDVYDNKNKLLTHASVRVNVKTGIRPRGDSARQYGIF